MFLQRDGFTGEGDSFTDAEGDALFGGVTWELMTGAYVVRILIDPDAEKADVVRLLRKHLNWLEQGEWPDDLVSSYRTEQAAGTDDAS